jgi:hypothetical protein
LVVMVPLLMGIAPALDWAASAAIGEIARLAAAAALPSTIPRRISSIMVSSAVWKTRSA